MQLTHELSQSSCQWLTNFALDQMQDMWLGKGIHTEIPEKIHI